MYNHMYCHTTLHAKKPYVASIFMVILLVKGGDALERAQNVNYAIVTAAKLHQQSEVLYCVRIILCTLPIEYGESQIIFTIIYYFVHMDIAIFIWMLVIDLILIFLAPLSVPLSLLIL
ncbi:hypothetical protein ACJX0J_035310 [Zea mays]